MKMKYMNNRFFLNIIDFCLYRNYRHNKQLVEASILSSSVVLYDHACPLCRAEMMRLKEHDQDGNLILLDINHPGFNQDTWGVSRSDASAALHVLTENNEWLTGMPAIRHVYNQVGLGWLMAPTGWPFISPLSDLAYRHIAPNRFLISRWLGLSNASSDCSNNACTPLHSSRED